ncbi:hypothetical protein ACFWUP_04810 [Nocardia sp. NPDC058658]|uniref:hypothetical protein n=1 Tax=Nocardia sp. NPDC058658 TaxID=3346580 RepID=UPI00364E6647
MRDPRWDHQIEERSWLYAGLAVDLGIDLVRLRAAYAGPPDSTGDSAAWLAIGVLGRLARRGDEDAVLELRRYLRTGRDLDLALSELIPVADHPAAQGLLDDVLDVADDDQLRWSIGMDRHGRTSLPQWRGADPRIDRAFAAGEAVRASWAREPAERQVSERDLVLRAAAESNLAAPASAADLTEEQWEATLLTIVTDDRRSVDHCWAPRSRRALRHAIEKSGSPAVLAWSRSMFTSRSRSDIDQEGYLEWLAFSMFTRVSATASDGPRLNELLVDAAAREHDGIGDQYELVDALARLDHVAATTTIENLYDTTVYAWLRRRCAAALSRLSPDFADERAVECLDDCESETRAIAIASVDPLVDDVRARLLRIADDPTEEDDNRRAAAARVLP